MGGSSGYTEKYASGYTEVTILSAQKCAEVAAASLSSTCFKNAEKAQITQQA